MSRDMFRKQMSTSKWKLCNRDTGICSTGCNLGFYGDICNNSSNVNCKTGYCVRSSGYCVGDCRDGYFGDKCSELCVCSKNGNSDQTTDFSPGKKFAISNTLISFFCDAPPFCELILIRLRPMMYTDLKLLLLVI